MTVPRAQGEGSLPAYVARQPIYTARGDVEAYELLYRSGNVGAAGDVGLRESSTMLVNAIGAFGFDALVGAKRAFINISEELLLCSGIEMLPQDRVVLEILENVCPTPEVLQGVQRLKEAGYMLALDDYTCQPELEAFLPLVDIVKFEVMGADPQHLRPRLRGLRSKGKKLLAEKVETIDEFRMWRDEGFSLFQGYFFAKPEVLSGKAALCNHGALVELLAKLHDPLVDIDEIERIISQDAGLSFRLLKMLRSAALGLSSRLGSVREAVFYLGLKKTSALATILMLSNVHQKPTELLQTALVRAHFCEDLAHGLRLPNPDSYFTLGLFSLLDAMLDLPMAEIVEQLPLSEEVSQALAATESDNLMARVLAFVVDWECGRSNELQGYDLQPLGPSQMYVHALARSEELIRLSAR